jgi:hypothetical protein
MWVQELARLVFTRQQLQSPIQHPLTIGKLLQMYHHVVLVLVLVFVEDTRLQVALQNPQNFSTRAK